MKVTDALTRLEKTDEFNEWNRRSGDTHLAHAFGIIESDSNDVSTWQIGYYNPEKDVLSVFSVNAEDVAIEEDETEAFKEENKKIFPIDVTQETCSSHEAITIADSLQQKHYPQHIPIKRFLILQKLSADEPQIWNITYLSQAFNTLNIKINAETRDVLEHKTISLIDSFQPGNK